MSDTDQLRTLGQKLAEALVGSYGAMTPGGKLVFLPAGVSIPHDIVQQGVINPTQLQTWLAINFDAPFLVSGDQGAVMSKDPSHGAASRIYAIAASNAQALGDPATDVWKRVTGQIAAAQASLGPPEAPKSIVCEPGDWALPPANDGYWTKFDSTETATATTTTETSTPVPKVRPQFWMVRNLIAVETAPPPEPPPPETPVVAFDPGERMVRDHRFEFAQQPQAFGLKRRFLARPMQASLFHPAEAAVQLDTATAVSEAPSVGAEVQAFALRAQVADLAVDRSAMIAVEPQASFTAQRAKFMVAREMMPERLESQVLFQNFIPVDQVITQTTDASSAAVTIHLEHQCVALGYFAGGQPWWDGVFLADPGWFVPGMPRGGLLPDPTPDSDEAYGLPISLVVVQNLKITGQWSAQASAALSAPGGTVGPLSLFGAVATTAADGVTITYAHDGMQVVALICSALPVLPPANTPSP